MAPPIFFNLPLVAQTSDMSHGCTSCHSAKILEVVSPHKWMSTEVLSQLQVNFLVRQLGEIQSTFEVFHFKNAEFVFQCLVGTKLNGLFSFTLVTFRFVSTVTGSVVVRQGWK